MRRPRPPLPRRTWIAPEVDILNPQLERLEQPQSTPVEQRRDEPGVSLEPVQYGAHLVAREHDRNRPRDSGAHQVVERTEVLTEDAAVQEE